MDVQSATGCLGASGKGVVATAAAPGRHAAGGPARLRDVLVQAPAATAATPPTPFYGTAVVDGNDGEWNLAADAYGALYEAGNSSKPVLADGYLRYDCSSQTMYVLVLQQCAGTPGAVPLLTSAQDSWVKVGTYPDVNPAPVVTGASGTNAGGTPPEFAWIGLGYDSNAGHAEGYEASFSLAANPPSPYDAILVHAGAFLGGAQTAAFVGFPQGGSVPAAPTEGPLAPGSYSFLATFSGGGPYAASTGACEPFTVAPGKTGWTFLAQTS